MSVAITFDDVSVTDKRKIIVDADIITSSAADAEAARQAAEEAEASAESASGYAESASASAEAAGASAESAAASAEEAEQTVSGLTEDVEELQKQMQAKAPVIISTASDAIASFSDGADDMACRSVVCQVDAVQSGSGDPSPTNIRPITGWDGMTVQRCGKNWFDVDNVEIGKAWNGTSNSARARMVIPWFTNTTFTISMNGTNSMDGIYIKSSDTVPASDAGASLTEFPKTYTTGSSGVKYLIVSFSKTGITKADIEALKLQIEMGSSATAYEVGDTDSHSFSFPSTVYGGWIDVVKGELHITKGFITFNGSENIWTEPSSGSGYYQFVAWIGQRFNAASSNTAITNYLPLIPLGDRGIVSGLVSYAADTGYRFCLNTDMGISTANQWKAYLAEHPLELCYTLAEPQIIPIDPVTIKTLLGNNNVYCNTGDTTAEYPADTKLYIEHLTAPDHDMIADSNIASGKFFMVGNSLYISTSAIAQGETIRVGTNCTQINLATALNNLAEA